VAGYGIRETGYESSGDVWQSQQQRFTQCWRAMDPCPSSTRYRDEYGMDGDGWRWGDGGDGNVDCGCAFMMDICMFLCYVRCMAEVTPPKPKLTALPHSLATTGATSHEATAKHVRPGWLMLE
jgi:hypothetical protein